MEATRSWSLATSDVPAELIAAFETSLAPRLDGAPFAECEAAAMALQNALVRAYLQRELARREAAFGAEVSVDGRRYRRHQAGQRTYHSLCGARLVERHTYRLVGVHNGPTIVPLELSAGLVELATPAFGYAVAQGYAAMPLWSFEAELRAAHREPPSRSTMERLATRVGGRLTEVLPQIEPALPDAARATDATISIGLDRTCAPMAEPRPAHACPAPRRQRTQPCRRQPPEPIDVNHRMPFVGTVALHDRHGDVLATTRVAATAGEGPAHLLDRLFDEAIAAQRAHRRASLVIVQDGAPELWTLVGDACRAGDCGPRSS